MTKSDHAVIIGALRLAIHAVEARNMDAALSILRGAVGVVDQMERHSDLVEVHHQAMTGALQPYDLITLHGTMVEVLHHCSARLQDSPEGVDLAEALGQVEEACYAVEEAVEDGKYDIDYDHPTRSESDRLRDEDIMRRAHEMGG